MLRNSFLKPKIKIVEKAVASFLVKPTASFGEAVSFLQKVVKKFCSPNSKNKINSLSMVFEQLLTVDQITH